MQGLEQVYRRHHTKNNNHKRNHAILAEERAHFIKKYIKPGSHLLDIGCRDGELIQYYNQKNKILGLDIDSEALRIAESKTGIDTRQCDLNGNWDVSESVFDGVIACEVIEHLYNPDVIFKKIYNVLKKDGVIIGSVPNAFNIQTRLKFLFGIKRKSPLADPTHINHFSKNELESLLKLYFSNVKISGIATKKYYILSRYFPFLFSHTLLFKAVKKEKNI